MRVVHGNTAEGWLERKNFHDERHGGKENIPQGLKCLRENHCSDRMNWYFIMDERGPGGPRYSRPGGRRYIHLIATSRGHGTSDFCNGLCLSIRFRKFVVFNASSHADTKARVI